MKRLFNFSVIMIMTVSIFGQSYYVEHENEIVQIKIDLDWSENGVYVQKKLDNKVSSSSYLDVNSILLVGDFHVKETEVVLNFEEFNYFYVPFDKDEPLFSLNASNINRGNGSLPIGPSPGKGGKGGSGGSGGGFVYYCTCGGHSPDAKDPGGCISSFDLATGVISCEKLGAECDNYCIGSAVMTDNKTIKGGGILIQTPLAQANPIYNFESGK